MPGALQSQASSSITPCNRGDLETQSPGLKSKGQIPRLCPRVESAEVTLPNLSIIQGARGK